MASELGGLDSAIIDDEPPPPPHESERVIELSVVMPCLNEADTLATCIEKAQRALREHGVVGEVIVADNGSTDGSQEIARGLGARVVDVEERLRRRADGRNRRVARPLRAHGRRG